MTEPTMTDNEYNIVNCIVASQNGTECEDVDVDALMDKLLLSRINTQAAVDALMDQATTRDAARHANTHYHIYSNTICQTTIRNNHMICVKLNINMTACVPCQTEHQHERVAMIMARNIIMTGVPTLWHLATT